MNKILILFFSLLYCWMLFFYFPVDMLFDNYLLVELIPLRWEYKPFQVLYVQNVHEILVVCHEAEGLGMDEYTFTWESIKDWSIQLQTEGYRIC